MLNAGWIAGVGLAALVQARELTEARFDALRDSILPGADELRWQEIGWRTSLREALPEASAQGRPVLLWAMNGHPLGCT